MNNIRTFQKQHSNKQWHEVCIVNTETNEFKQFQYQLINGKLLKFSESVTANESKYPVNCLYWLKNNRKWFNYEEVSNDFLDGYPLWNPATDLTDEIRKQYRVI